MTVQLFCGDCLEILPTLPTGSVDLVVADPPYGIGYEYKSYDDTKENLLGLIAGAMPEIRRVAKRAAIFCGVQNVSLYPPSDWIISYSWNTTGTYGMMGYNQWQPILFYGKDCKGFGNINGILKSDSIKISGGAGVGFMRDYKKGEHPCPKPINVIEMLVNRLSFEGDTVLDCFMGSGTTGVACVKTGRNFIGIEISPDYFAIAERRISEAQMQPALLEATA